MFIIRELGITQILAYINGNSNSEKETKMKVYISKVMFKFHIHPRFLLKLSNCTLAIKRLINR